MFPVIGNVAQTSTKGLPRSRDSWYVGTSSPFRDRPSKNKLFRVAVDFILIMSNHVQWLHHQIRCYHEWNTSDYRVILLTLCVFSRQHMWSPQMQVSVVKIIDTAYWVTDNNLRVVPAAFFLFCMGWRFDTVYCVTNYNFMLWMNHVQVLSPQMPASWWRLTVLCAFAKSTDTGVCGEG